MVYIVRAKVNSTPLTIFLYNYNHCDTMHNKIIAVAHVSCYSAVLQFKQLDLLFLLYGLKLPIFS